MIPQSQFDSIPDAIEAFRTLRPPRRGLYSLGMNVC